jgi:hypothetical protein
MGSDTMDPINGAGNTNASVSFQATSSGTHYIKVSTESSIDSGYYSLRVLPKYGEPGASWDAAYEPNNFPANAYAIDVGRTNFLSAAIEPRGTAYDTDRADRDYYRFEAVSGNTYVVESFNAEASVGSSSHSLEMWIYDSVLNEMGSDTMDPINGAGNTNASVSFQATSSGTHYIKVSPESSVDSGDYSLRVLPKYDEPGASWDAAYEPNNFPANAYPLQIAPCAIDSDIEERLSSYDTDGPDHDWFVISASAGTNYTIDVFDMASSLPDGLILEVYDYQLNLLQQATDATQISVSFAPATSGTYYLRVEPDDVNENGAYSIRAASIADSVCAPVTSTISGSVTDSIGRPVADVTISTDTGATATTASDGSYTLSGLADGSYTLSAAKSGCTFAPASHTVTVPPDATGQSFTATCAATTSTISGSVTEANGSPVEGVTISASDGSSATTASDGSYTFSGLADGSYTLSAAKSGCNFALASLNVSVPPDATGQSFIATCAATSTISGNVSDANGNGIADVTVTTDSGQTATTASNGSYTLSGLADGSYTLSAAKSGCTFAPASHTVTVPPDISGKYFIATCDATNPPGTPTLDIVTNANAIEPDEAFEFSIVTSGIPDATGIEFALAYDDSVVDCTIGFPGDDQSFPFFTLERSVCNAAPGRYEWVSTVSEGGFVAGELARLRFHSQNTETTSTIRIVPGSVNAVDQNGNTVPINVGTDEITFTISSAAIEGVVTCQASSSANPRQTRIFASSYNGMGTSIFTLSQSGSPYSLPASTSGNPWSVIAACDCHINARILDVDSPSTGNDVTLQAGDLVGVESDRDDGEINIRDAIAVAARLGGAPGDLVCADLNQDGNVDVADLAILRGNFGLREFTPFDGQPPALADATPEQNAATTVSCRVEPVADTSRSTLIIEVDSVTDLYGYSLNLATDPTLAQATDQGWDISNSLLQPDPDGPSVMQMQNDVIGESLDVAVMRQSPAPAVSGSGELARIEFQSGSTTGTHTFSFNDIILADRDANFIPHQVGDMSQCQFISDGSGASSSHSLYLPLIAR